MIVVIIIRESRKGYRVSQTYNNVRSGILRGHSSLGGDSGHAEIGRNYDLELALITAVSKFWSFSRSGNYQNHHVQGSMLERICKTVISPYIVYSQLYCVLGRRLSPIPSQMVL